jgi:hypothetical protein
MIGEPKFLQEGALYSWGDSIFRHYILLIEISLIMLISVGVLWMGWNFFKQWNGKIFRNL